MTIAQQLEQKGIEKGFSSVNNVVLKRPFRRGARSDSENSPYHAPERH